MTMDLDDVLTRSSNAAYRVYDGQATVVLPDGAEVNVLNEIGSLVWEAIDGRRTLGEILDTVLREYDIGREEAHRDILEFVASLKEHRMVS
jgi:hypothetical protein